MKKTNISLFFVSLTFVAITAFAACGENQEGDLPVNSSELTQEQTSFSTSISTALATTSYATSAITERVTTGVTYETTTNAATTTTAVVQEEQETTVTPVELIEEQLESTATEQPKIRLLEPTQPPVPPPTLPVPTQAPLPPPQPLPPTPTDIVTVTSTFNVALDCVGCEVAIAAVISSIDGVISVSASYNSGSITVVHESRLSADTIRNRISEAGYSVT
ncbi:MAG: cation transporter [Oscillospiraceae bacterium]|nr:cation transporter [Oscillospiraceae bacterium]